MNYSVKARSRNSSTAETVKRNEQDESWARMHQHLSFFMKNYKILLESGLLEAKADMFNNADYLSARQSFVALEPEETFSIWKVGTPRSHTLRGRRWEMPSLTSGRVKTGFQPPNLNVQPASLPDRPCSLCGLVLLRGRSIRQAQTSHSKSKYETKRFIDPLAKHHLEKPPPSNWPMTADQNVPARRSARSS